ncbi:hypothetical protein HAX54_052446, partial [Datura stramonium]|nr:hypothetical protein [Datura stramonium]
AELVNGSVKIQKYTYLPPLALDSRPPVHWFTPALDQRRATFIVPHLAASLRSTMLHIIVTHAPWLGKTLGLIGKCALALARPIELLKTFLSVAPCLVVAS